jgi:hypothetical protein
VSGKAQKAKRLARCTSGAIALTASQMFLGAVSLGIGMFRGSDVYTAFHHEGLIGDANYSSSKLGADHARSANVVTNNNVVMAGIMGPRFGVESDNIAMDANAEVACPTCPHSPTCSVCKQYAQNKPRAMAKMIWARAKQAMLWGSLGKLSGEIDKLASQQANGIINGEIGKLDPSAMMRIADPSTSGDIWGGGNAGTACKLSMKDILPSPVTGHAFPGPSSAMLITPNLLEGLPKALVQMMPQMICAVTSSMSGGGGGGGSGGNNGPQLPQIPSIAKQTNAECTDLERQMRCAVAAAGGGAGNCGDFQAPEIADVSDTTGGGIQLPSQVQKYVTCGAGSASNPLGDISQGGYSYRAGGSITTCTFDRNKCLDQELTDNSDSYLRDKLGLPKVVSTVQSLASMLGGSETRKPSQGGSNPQNFCACGYAQKQVDQNIVQISDAVRKVASFGQAQPSQALRQSRDYRSCSQWYFPDRKGEFTATPKDQQPFVGAWKFGMTTQCQGQGGGT